MSRHVLKTFNPRPGRNLTHIYRHLEGASGMLGMIKAILMVKNGVILPTAGFENINPNIPGKEKVRVAETPLPWPRGERRRALVTNFGKKTPSSLREETNY